MKQYLLLLFFCFPLIMQAENVSETKARQVASTFLKSSQNSRAGDVELDLVYAGSSSRFNPVVPYYVFNNRYGEGFVIVSGEDRIRPILGFSTTGRFDAQHLGDGVKGWLLGMEAKINAVRAFADKPWVNDEDEWQHIGSRSINPAICYETAMWGKSEPFNKELPYFAQRNQNASFGPMASSLAVVLRHREWPDKGVGTFPAYEYDTEGQHIKIEQRTLGNPYLWNEMPLDVDVNTPQQSVDQIVQLMMDLGAMFKTQYKVWGTEEDWRCTDNIINLLQEHLSISPEVRMVEERNFTPKQWNALILQSLKETGPLLYEAGNNRWCVVDGYLKDGFFHINFADYGQNNGYFLLEPTGDMNEFVIGMQGYDRAILDLKNNEGALTVHEEVMLEDIVMFTKQVEQNHRFRIDFYGVEHNLAPQDEQAVYEIVPWLTDKDGVMKEMIAQPIERNPKYIPMFQCEIKQPIAAGDRIRLYFKSKYTPEWTLVHKKRDAKWEVIFKDALGNIASFEDRISIDINRKAGTIRVKADDNINVKVLKYRLDVTEQCIKEGNELIISFQKLNVDFVTIIFEEGELVKRLQIQI